MTSQLLAHVALLSPPYAILTYSLPSYLPAELWSPGLRVAAPLGKGFRAAVLLETAPHKEGEALPPGLRPLLWPLEQHPLLPPDYLALARQLGLRQAMPLGRILGTVLPAPLRSARVRLRFFGPKGTRDLQAKDLAALSPADLAECASLWCSGNCVCLGGAVDALDREVCTLAQDPPWPVRPRATKQMAFLEYLLAHGSATRRRLVDTFGPEAGETLKTLVGRGLVSLRPLEEAACLPKESGEGCATGWTAPFALTEAQRGALAAFEAYLDAPFPGPDASRGGGGSSHPATHLVHGVTGSGKTAVYLSLAASCLVRGRSIMLLAPEVSLALKLRQDVREHLPNAPLFFYHGYQSPQEREATFRALAEREAPALIVGTRSALFLPVRNLGAIVLDEEHDGSFKQDEGLNYQAKEVAWFRTGQVGALLVMGSATPDVKTFYAAEKGQIPLHSLPDRVGGGNLPQVRFVGLPRSMGDGGLLAEESINALAGTVDRGEQAVILLNRRGYSPLMYCLDCGAVLRCPHCAISLTYHKGRERVVCHYCGHTAPFPCPCPSCSSLHYLPMGEGTEKLEESLLPLLPSGARILRLDRDSTRRPGRMEEILSAFGRGEASVLVGTQMLSKGLHFPNVTLVVAADADLGLNLPDYRAAERTFQLLVQASGRSGRGEKAGEVLVQTRDPEHYCWQYVRENDYAGFYRQEIAMREKRRYPPFVRLGLVRMSFPVIWSGGAACLDQITLALRAAGKEAGVIVLGPAPAPLAQLKGRRRFHCLIKAQDWGVIRNIYAKAVQAAGKGQMRLALDLDPVNML